MSKCGQKCEVYDRVVGYYRPLQDMHEGKRMEKIEKKHFTKVGDRLLFTEDQIIRQGKNRIAMIKYLSEKVMFKAGIKFR